MPSATVTNPISFSKVLEQLNATDSTPADLVRVAKGLIAHRNQNLTTEDVKELYQISCKLEQVCNAVPGTPARVMELATHIKTHRQLPDPRSVLSSDIARL